MKASLIKKCSYEFGFYSLCIGTLFLSFPLKWSLYPLGLFLIFGLFAWLYDFKLLINIFFKKASLIALPVIYFLLHLVNLLFVEAKWSYIEGNLFLILIPLFGFPIFISEIFNRRINTFIKCFIIGLLIICIFEFLRAANLEIFSFDIKKIGNAELGTPSSKFMSFNLSVFEHPIYLSMKVLFSIVLLISFRQYLRIPLFIQISVIILLLVYVYFLSSRTGFLISILLSLFYLYNYLDKYKLKLLVIVLAPLIFFAFYKISTSNSRVNFKTDFFLNRLNSEKLKLRDVDVRFTSWFTAIDLIKEHPLFGIGLNSQDILADEYKKQGYNNEAKLRLNAHNQFLETQLTFGIPGTIVLLWMLFAPLFGKSRLQEPPLYKAFLIIIVTGFFFASGLERQYCLTFFTLFYTFQILWRAGQDSEIISIK